MSDDPHNNEGQTQAQNGSTYRADLDIGYATPALEKIRSSLKGNGIKSDTVKIEKFKGETLEFIATTTLEIKSKLSEKTIAGKVSGPQRVDNPQNLRDLVEKKKQKITSDQISIKSIKELLLSREDKGFGINQQVIKLTSLKSDYVYYEPCPPCNSQGKIKCQRCHGQGYEQCTRCHGDGYESCHHCNGARQIQGQGGQYQPCPQCHGHGKTSCTLCQQTKRVQCSVCKTAGTTQCKQCGGQGWGSHISMLEHEALCLFDYDRSIVPERIQSIFEKYKENLHKHLNFQPIIFEKEPEQDRIILPYKVTLPYAEVEVLIGKNLVPCFIFGQEAHLINTPNFLNDVLKKPIQLMAAASNGQGNIITHVKSALRYKTIRQAFKAAIKFREQKATKALYRATPAGLERDTALKLIQDANSALKHLTRKQVQTARAMAGIGGIALFLAYYMTSVRTIVASKISNNALHIALDILVFLVIGTIAYAITRKISDNARRSLVARLFSNN